MTLFSRSSGTALITGASSGIGAAYAERLAQRGYDVILVARDRSRLNALAAKLTAVHGVQSEVLPADLTRDEDLSRVAQRLADDERITLLVNNAGITVDGDFLDADINSINSLIALNITAPTRLAHAAGNRFKARGRGTIINLASVLALIHEMSNGAYNASKAFVLTLTRALERELKQHGVQVQAVLPGITRTEIFNRSGQSIDEIPTHMIMEVETLVDASLAGLDLGESVTIPSLESLAQWQQYESARAAMIPGLSLSQSASRYRQ
ncbi:SDR family NAD(P)-dependent oxidoreductase [Winslowiella iniecta]|uniref:AraC family transcriptional regulator n=1 Tax=Winslowiella iniecta TaxID=1560201 RepID=A0A0L7TFF3_9GAMM|nr:SDR family oxidoreductase [Winslowiella iniecta]KOC90089.1 AraC family transcriptional regulator [Winslowiella iniecta]KOC94085.1 AraC family transcriptional regulator [Winslowiella iniecta]